MFATGLMLLNKQKVVDAIKNSDRNSNKFLRMKLLLYYKYLTNI